MIIAATGHRPDKLGGYKREAVEKLERFALVQLGNHRPLKVISGMALGWDQAIAKAGINLGIPVIAAIPFVGQEKAWFNKAQEDYIDLLSHCSEIKVVCEGGYSPQKMQIRNEWMVDNCDKLLALWNGSKGGTANCLAYAKSKNRPVLNVWSYFQ